MPDREQDIFDAVFNEMVMLHLTKLEATPSPSQNPDFIDLIGHMSYSFKLWRREMHRLGIEIPVLEEESKSSRPAARILLPGEHESDRLLNEQIQMFEESLRRGDKGVVWVSKRGFYGINDPGTASVWDVKQTFLEAALKMNKGIKQVFDHNHKYREVGIQLMDPLTYLPVIDSAELELPLGNVAPGALLRTYRLWGHPECFLPTERTPIDHLSQIDISNLNLKTLTYNVLKRGGVNNVLDVLRLEHDGLTLLKGEDKIRNFGETMFFDLLTKLALGGFVPHFEPIDIPF